MTHGGMKPTDHQPTRRDRTHHVGGAMAELDTIPAADSTVSAYVRIPAGARAGVVVLHPWWGLNDDVIAYAGRLAGAGYGIFAPDMFGGEVATEIEDADRLSSGMDEEAGKAITLAAVDRLAARLGPG